MTESSLKERFARLGRVEVIDRVRSGFPEEVVLEPAGKDVVVVAAVMALAQRGLTMLKAKRAIDAMIENGRIVVDIPLVESADALARDLSAAGLVVKFRGREDLDLARSLAERLKALRQRLGLSQELFALTYGFDVKTVRGWERGKVADRGNRAFLRVIEQDPKMAEELVNR